MKKLLVCLVICLAFTMFFIPASFAVASEEQQSEQITPKAVDDRSIANGEDVAAEEQQSEQKTPKAADDRSIANGEDGAAEEQQSEQITPKAADDRSIANDEDVAAEEQQSEQKTPKAADDRSIVNGEDVAAEEQQSEQITPKAADDRSIANDEDVAAEEQQSEQKTPKAADGRLIANGEELLGKWWWTRNAKRFTPLPNPLLYRFEAAYSFSDTGGNIEAKTQRGKAELALRKQLFTSKTAYSISKSDTEIALSGKKTSVNAQNFQQGFRYALTDWMEPVVGMSLILDDSSKYFKKRMVYFGGALFGLINRPDLILRAGGYYAYTDTEYMNDKISDIPKYADFQPVEDYKSGSLYFNQLLRWKITDTISLTESAEYLQLLKDTDYYSWMLKLDLQFKLTKHISFVTSYAFDYDNTSFIEAVQNYLEIRSASGLPSGDMEEINTSLAAGIKISF